MSDAVGAALIAAVAGFLVSLLSYLRERGVVQRIDKIASIIAKLPDDSNDAVVLRVIQRDMVTRFYQRYTVQSQRWRVNTFAVAIASFVSGGLFLLIASTYRSHGKLAGVGIPVAIGATAAIVAGLVALFIGGVDVLRSLDRRPSELARMNADAGLDQHGDRPL